MFSEAIYKEWEWSERYPGPTEIRSYLNFVSKKLDLRKNIKFNTSVEKAHFIEDANQWEITTANGLVCRSTYLITAIGCISSANIPNIPGLEEFTGDWYHTGKWPHENVSFKDKRVDRLGRDLLEFRRHRSLQKQLAIFTFFKGRPITAYLPEMLH